MIGVGIHVGVSHVGFSDSSLKDPFCVCARVHLYMSPPHTHTYTWTYDSIRQFLVHGVVLSCEIIPDFGQFLERPIVCVCVRVRLYMPPPPQPTHTYAHIA